MEAREVGAGQDHPVEQRLDLGVALCSDRRHLARIPESAGILREERAQRRGVALAQDVSQPIDILTVGALLLFGHDGPSCEGVAESSATGARTGSDFNESR